MKTKVFSALFLTFGMLMASCGSDQGKSLDQISNASQSDSLAYYYGQMIGSEYWQRSHRDTTFKTEEARRAYIEAFNRGLSLVRENKAYNEGLMDGIQAALEMTTVNEEFGVNLPKSSMVNGLAYSLRNDTISDNAEAQAYIQKTIMGLQQAKEIADKAAGEKALSAAATKAGMTKVGSDLYRKGAAPADTLLKDGQKAAIELKVTTENGKEVNIPIPTEVEMGRFPKGSVLDEALRTMSTPGNAQFMTTAQALLGPNCRRMDLNPAEVLILNISLKPASAE